MYALLFIGIKLNIKISQLIGYPSLCITDLQFHKTNIGGNSIHYKYFQRGLLFFNY